MTQKQGLKTRNHYIPQMLLKNFSTNEEVFTFSKEKEIWIQYNKQSLGTSTKGTGYEKGLYVYKDIEGQKNDSLENLFNQYETPTDIILQKIIKNTGSTFITPIDKLLNRDEIVELIFFIVLFSNKTAFSIDNEALKEYKKLKFILSQNSLENIDVMVNKTGVFVNQFFDIIKNSYNFKRELDVFLDYNLFIINNHQYHDLSFILSDTLLIKNQYEEFFLPIGSKHILYGTHRTKTMYKEERNFIKEINRLSAIKYYQYIYYHINCNKIKRLILNHKNDNITNINTQDLINLINWEKEIKSRNIII